MSFEIIKQNIQSLLELNQTYQDLLNQKQNFIRTNNKVQLAVIEQKISLLKNYFLKIVTSINKVIQEQESKIKNEQS